MENNYQTNLKEGLWTVGWKMDEREWPTDHLT
jgi:hypothetical protein